MVERTLVVGLGNPILGDDGVGWRVVDEVERRMRPGAAVVVERAALGGLSLMERMVGYPRAVIVDAVHAGAAVGTVHRCRLAELGDPSAGHTTSTHDVSLATALALGRAVGAAVPDEIEVVGIEVPPQYDFSDTLSPAAAAAVPRAATMVLECVCSGRATVSSQELRQEGASHGVA